MTTDPDCIFCKIVAGDIPSFKVYEDDKTFAFMDINPGNPGHALIVPRVHTANIYDVAVDDMAAAMVTVQKVARAVRAVLDPYGLNIVQANGPGAAQSVQHVHWHVLPRAEGDELKLNWGLVPGDMDAIGALAEQLRAAV